MGEICYDHLSLIPDIQCLRLSSANITWYSPGRKAAFDFCSVASSGSSLVLFKTTEVKHNLRQFSAVQESLIRLSGTGEIVQQAGYLPYAQPTQRLIWFPESTRGDLWTYIGPGVRLEHPRYMTQTPGEKKETLYIYLG